MPNAQHATAEVEAASTSSKPSSPHKMSSERPRKRVPEVGAQPVLAPGELAPASVDARSGGDSESSIELAEMGSAALAAGKRREAESLFHRALGLDHGNAAALIGLSDLEFDRGSYLRAADFADKAVLAAPRNGVYQMRLGDAYFKLLKYSAARRAYERAKELGIAEAEDRLAKIESRLRRSLARHD